MDAFRLSAVPSELKWKNQPLDWSAGPDGSLTIVAGELTDTFNDPGGTNEQDNAPAALFIPPDSSFLLSAKVAVDFAADFDAGVLQVRISDDVWGKLCFEYSPQGEPMVVSVVTRGKSDDCNSVIVDGREVYLRAAVTPKAIAFHYSRDGVYWHFVRYFTLGRQEPVRAGFASQSPRGKQCKAVFSDIRYGAGVLSDNRNGE